MAMLPPTVDRAVAGLTARVRRRRSVRGWTYVVVVGLAIAALIVLADFAFELPRIVRSLLFVSWLAVVALAVRRFVTRPQSDDVPFDRIAGTIESRYPNFGERLLTLSSVRAGAGSGSPHLVAQLSREIEKRAHVVEPDAAVPIRGAVRLAIVAGLTAAVALLAMLVVPGGPRRVQRFVLPWSDGKPPSAFRVVVTSGEPVLRRGDPLPITAYLERLRPGELPTTLTASVKSSNAAETSVVMVGDGRGAYRGQRPNVRDDLAYAVLFDGEPTPWHAVKVADPVQLADGTTTTVTPPDYARSTAPTGERPGFDELDLLAHSTVVWRFAFDRTPQTATLEFVGESGRRDRIPLAGDRATFGVRESGTLTLSTTGEHGLRTDSTAAIRVRPDGPPRFERVTGLALQALEIKPGERLPIAIAASDDLAVTAVRLEYRIAESNSPATSVPIPATGIGTRLAEGRLTFDTAGLCPAGQTLLVRLVAEDNRQWPAEKLGPQVTYFPASEWLPLRVTAAAKSLAEQQIFGQRDRIADSLRKALDAVQAARQSLATVAGSNAYQLGDDHIVRIKSAREQLAEARDELVRAARDARLIPELDAVAREAEAIAAGPVASADQSAASGLTQAEVAPRRAALQAGHRSSVEAEPRIEALIALNAELAKRRLERRLLQEIGREERDLADRLKAATTDAERAAIAAEQKALRERLEKTVREHDGLRSAADARAAATAAERAKEAAALEAEHDALTARRRDAETKALAARNAEFAAKQKEVANDILRATGTNGDPARSAAGAAERFDKGDPLAAMADQESAARQLDQYAESLDRAAEARRDPKEAARQIAEWQADYAKRLETIVKSIPYDRLPEPARTTLATEAAQLQKAIDSISVPSMHAKFKSAAVKQTAEAAKKMTAPEWAAAAKATRELADRLPTKADRAKAAKIEINKLLDRQNELVREFVETKGKPEKLPNLADRQAAVAATTAALDAPGHEPRRDRAAATARTTADDLRSGNAADAATGLKSVVTQLERLRQALDGIEPVDAAIDRLARQQSAIADRVDRLRPDSPAAERDELAKLQREVGRELATQSPGESPTLTRDAKDRVNQLDKAMRDPVKPDVDELKKKSKAAADSLNVLADRVAGAESDGDRLARLQRNRDDAAKRATAAVGTPLNPEASAEARRAVQADLDELNQTRTGQDDGAKAKARDALTRLKGVPDPDRQPELQKQAAEALAALKKASTANDTPAPRPTPKPDFAKQSAPGLPTTDRAAEARELAAKQRALRDQASQAATGGAGAAGGELGKAEADLAGKIATLAKELNANASTANQSGSAAGTATANATRDAAGRADHAAKQADRAIRESVTGRPDSAAQARQETKKALAETRTALAGTPPAGPAPEGTGTADAARAMAAAERALGDQKPDDARSQMTRAADALAGQPDNPKPDPANRPAPGQKPPSAATALPLPTDLKKYEGAAWGDLPGDVKNRIVQDWAAKYGDDAARAIKLYFEQLAERP